MRQNDIFKNEIEIKIVIHLFLNVKFTHIDRFCDVLNIILAFRIKWVEVISERNALWLD